MLHVSKVETPQSLHRTELGPNIVLASGSLTPGMFQHLRISYGSRCQLGESKKKREVSQVFFMVFVYVCFCEKLCWQAGSHLPCVTLSRPHGLRGCPRVMVFGQKCALRVEDGLPRCLSTQSVRKAAVFLRSDGLLREQVTSPHS